MTSKDNVVRSAKRAGLIVIWAASLIFAAQWGHAQVTAPKPPDSINPVISGNDIGFRLESQKGSSATGTFVVRINGEWLTANPAGSVKPLIASGSIRPIAMTGPARSASMPELATFGEQGVRNIDLPVWIGVYAPAGTPRATLIRLRNELKEVTSQPDVVDKMVAQGQTPIVNTAEEFIANYRAEYQKWEALIKASGAKVE